MKPVTEGVGMRMLQKMGWRQGQPLGKNNAGYIAPIPVDVKVGRAGLMASEEEAIYNPNFNANYGILRKRCVQTPIVACAG